MAVKYPGLSSLSYKLEKPDLLSYLPKPPYASYYYPPKKSEDPLSKNSGNSMAALGVGVATDYLSNQAGQMFGDSELGRNLGTLFSSGISSTGNTITNNLIKGEALALGLGLNVGASVGGAGAGILSNYIGLGINSLGGDTMLSRGIGAGVATGLGTVGGLALSNLAKFGTIAGRGADGAKIGLIGKAAGSINPYALGMTVAGTALGAAFGPSKEYNGRHGNITKTMDTIYDLASIGVNAIPGAGQIISAAMVLNKGLSNIFGSTDGMTTQDAILGSAFMPAPVKWLNMWGANTTDTFGNQSWLNSEKANSFMGNAFGNLSDKFDTAREEAGKTYGTFSLGAYKDALKNLKFANTAWNKILAMADLNEILKIRSLYMTSINNQRYAQQIGGAWLPVYRGKQGMKIFNNASNHNMGMRLLSAAALIDNKQMILSAQV